MVTEQEFLLSIREDAMRSASGLSARLRDLPLEALPYAVKIFNEFLHEFTMWESMTDKSKAPPRGPRPSA